MKILMLTASLRSGGAETHILELSRALCHRGHSVTVASSGGEIADILSKDGICHLKIPLDSKLPHHLFLSYLKLRALVEREKFDIIHVHSRIAALVCKLAVSKRLTQCVVSTVHSHFKTTPLLRRLSFWGRASIAVSDDLRDYLSTEYSIPHESIRVIPNAINTHKFRKSSQKVNKSKCQSPPRIVFVSRLDTDCSLGASLLCHIAPKLAKKYPRIVIEIVGGGSAFHKLSLSAKKLNDCLGYECVKMCGKISNVADKLNSADLFVGVSRAALEAMSSSVPVILCGNEGFLGILDASNISLAQSTNFCCRGTELPNTITLYRAICSVLDMKRAERDKLGNYLREYVCLNHSREKLAELTEKFYRESLENIPAKKGQIVLCGYYGFDNLGDDALLCCAITHLKKSYPDKSISVICHSPARVSRSFGVRTVARENVLATLKEISAADKLIFGGGSVLQNATSNRSLEYYCSLIRFASKRGIPVELLSNGLGPIKGKRACRVTKKALLSCSGLSFRDSASATLARSLGCYSDISIEDDLSAHLCPCDDSRIEQILSAAGALGRKLLLIGIKGKTDRKTRKDIEKEIFLQSRGALLPTFVIMHAHEDKKISKAMAKRHNGVCLKNLSPSELCALCQRADFAIGNRYHLLYIASRAGVPILPFGDDPKLLSVSKINLEGVPN